MVNRQDNIFDAGLSDTEHEVLAELQTGISLTACPYNELAKKLAVCPDEILAIISNLLRKNILREISPVFNAAGLGYASTLVAAAVPSSLISAFIDFLDLQPGISHNYGRRHKFNVWFTLALPDQYGQGAVIFEPFLSDLKMRFGLDAIISLPVIRMFKLNVRFGHQAQAGSPGIARHIVAASAREPMGEREKQLVRSLQAGIPVSTRPFADIAQRPELAGLFPPVTESEILQTMQLWCKNGILRRVSGRVRHYNMGYAHNAMVVFALESDLIDGVGQKIAALDCVSHCYHRQRNEAWPYDLYAMVHAVSELELTNNISYLAELAGPSGFQVLHTECEYKKQAVRYFE